MNENVSLNQRIDGCSSASERGAQAVAGCVSSRSQVASTTHGSVLAALVSQPSVPVSSGFSKSGSQQSVTISSAQQRQQPSAAVSTTEQDDRSASATTSNDRVSSQLESALLGVCDVPPTPHLNLHQQQHQQQQLVSPDAPVGSPTPSTSRTSLTGLQRDSVSSNSSPSCTASNGQVSSNGQVGEKSMTWIYVIKSGRVKVVRKQTVFASRASKNDDALERDKPLKFTEGLAGVSFPQRETKQTVQEFEQAERLARKQQKKAAEKRGGTDGAPPVPAISLELIDELFGNSVISPEEVRRRNQMLPPIQKDKWDSKKKALTARGVGQVCKQASKKMGKLIEFEEMNTMSLSNRERGRDQQKKFAELPTRVAYVVIDSLGEGDIIGLWHLDNDKSPTHRSGSSNDKIVLISDGAELIQINKRHFLDHASNNAMVKVETLLKQSSTKTKRGRSFTSGKNGNVSNPAN